MDNRPRLFLTAAFLCGVLFTLGFKDFYPDLERRFRRRRSPADTLVSAGLDRIDLEDHTKTQASDKPAHVEIPEGIEAAKGYLAHICMPSDQATEKSDLLLKLGAVVDRVPPAPIIDPMHFVNRARSLAADHTADPKRPGRGYFADQFENQANWKAHFDGTGPEIFQQCGGKLDAFVAGAGTGGTIAGVARFLKPKVPHLRVVLADPQGSGLFNRIKYGVMFDTLEKEGTRRRSQTDTIVEGIGINRVTANFEAGRELVDDAIKVSDEEALAMARLLAEKDGIFVGSSSSVNCESSQNLMSKLSDERKALLLHGLHDSWDLETGL
ncbi:MAG: hypothetical protein Q9211_004198 [Gyalolechia sp. 1 TL-2023]